MPEVQRMGLAEKEQQLIDDLNMFDEWMDKYQFIIDMGKESEGLPDAEKTDDLLVKGCQSRVWLKAEKVGDVLVFRSDSDAIIPKGIAAMIARLYSGHTPEEILAFRPTFVEKTGLAQHLTPTRANGLSAILKRIQQYALAYKTA